MANVLILYSTTDGHTIEICRRLQQVIESRGRQVVLASIADAPVPDLAAFDLIVIGASIRYGRHNPQVTAFINQHQAALQRQPNAFFSVNLVARKLEKNSPKTNPYLQKFLRTIAWQPQRMAVFAGRLDYPKYGFFDRQIIRCIMWLTGGPTDPASTTEFTDWQQVEAFGRELAD